MAIIGTDIDYAASLLKAGKLVAIPTDTVYGLAGDGTNSTAVQEIYHIKGRSCSKPLIAQISSMQKMKVYARDIPTNAVYLANFYWPGALTLVLHSANIVAKEMLSGGKTIGVRIPNHQITMKLLNMLEFPLAVSSANLSGEPSPKTPNEVQEQIGNKIEYILDGGTCTIGQASSIVAFDDEQPKMLREGTISKQEIFKTLNL